METTRGNRELPDGFSREAEIERLSHALQRVLDRKGSVLLPTFALGRTQEILALLALLMAEGKLPRQPVYIGGLGRVFTEIYDLESHRTHRQYPNLQLREALNLIVLEQMTENTAAHNLALRLMNDKRHAIFFVGYTDPDTPGGRLRTSTPGEPFLFGAAAGEVKRLSEIGDFDLTAHANRDELLDFVGEVEPRTVLLSHGQDDSRQWFEEQIRLRYPKIKVIQPKPGETVEA
jgi:Cft2 family RNA processing exonuclease